MRAIGVAAILLAFIASAAAQDHGSEIAPETEHIIDLNGQLNRLVQEGRYEDAQLIAEKVRELLSGLPEQPNDKLINMLRGKSLSELANIYLRLGRFDEAEALTREALKFDERTGRSLSIDAASARMSLVSLYLETGRSAEAEAVIKEALTIYQDAEKKSQMDLGEWKAAALSNMGDVYIKLGREQEAVQYFSEALALDRAGLAKAQSPSNFVNSAVRLASVLHRLGRTDEAIPLLAEAVALHKTFPYAYEADQVLFSAVAMVNFAIGNYKEAQTFAEQAIAVLEERYGPNHPYLTPVLGTLGQASIAQGQTDLAEQALMRGLDIFESHDAQPDADHSELSSALGMLHLSQAHWKEAEARFGKGIEIYAKAVEYRNTLLNKSLLGRRPEFSEQVWQGAGYAKAAYRIAEDEPARKSEMAKRSFEKVQVVALSKAASSVVEMAARNVVGNPELSKKVRRRQDLWSAWSEADKRMFEQRALPDERRDPELEASLARRLGEISHEVAGIDAELLEEFPDFAAFTSAKPMSVDGVQQQLHDDEVLVLFLDTQKTETTPAETFIWAVRKSGEPRWVRVELGTDALNDSVAALRCGLDRGAWRGKGAERCKTLLGRTDAIDPKGHEPLPFDVSKAHELYEALFGGLADVVEGKHLLVVPSGALTRLPLEALVTASPAPGQKLRDVAWLARKNAVTVLPSVASLGALRHGGAKSQAQKPTMIAFANPTLDGNGKDPILSTIAHYRQSCDLPPSKEEALLETIADFATAGAEETIEQVKQFAPIPRTATQVCAIAKDPAFAGSVVYLGSEATEGHLHKLNGDNELAKYSIVQFATHGVMAGQVRGVDEPGLILTPSDNPSAADASDDGYLTASEVTELKLDADWVILSACNTAAGGEKGGEALSGLARAFLYAQARALLVSHWSVYERAAVKLVTGAVHHQNADGAGRSEAMRRAMVDILDQGTEAETHPAFWAPFVVVGEGAGTR